ncbi:glutathione S-transferase [Favolaschia claudopus]|uniref:glutathione transferase n=1 Tax=Favolaschia claudopus TaxID=2862362 RepID=A0AAW0E355_9AGAR
MVFKLYASPFPVAGGGIVALVLAEKQAAFELVPIDLRAKEQKAAEYMAMNPFGRVPAINDDGFVMYESRAICRYVDEKFAGQGTTLVPKGMKERALVEQAVSVESVTLFPPLDKVVWEVVVKPERGLAPDQAIVDTGLKEISDTLDVYEVILGKHRYLAGDDFTLADLVHCGYLPFLVEKGVDIMTVKARPNVARWWNELMSRPTWVKLQAEGMKSTV